MKFYIYSIYDPEVQSFDSRLNLGPLDPKEMKEQYRRAHVKMKGPDKAFMQGKKAIMLGVFDDETGKITQSENLLEVYHFISNDKKEDESSSQVEKEEEEAANA